VYTVIAAIASTKAGLLLPLALPLVALVAASTSAAIIRRRLPPAPRPEASE
jgi:hypothetical protein